MKTSRRNFLRSTCIAAAGLPFIGTLCAVDAENGKINIAVIGLGKQGLGHISSLLYTEDFRITHICDVAKDRLDFCENYINKVYSERLGSTYKVKTERDWRNVVADKSVDAVLVATVDHWHALMSIAAARAGKHIYCEKPLTFTVDEGIRLRREVNKSGVVFQCGSMQRSMGSFRNAAQLANCGALGEIREVYCNFPRKFPTILNWEAEPIPEGVDWDMWIGPANMNPYSRHLLHPLLPAPHEYSFPWGEWRWHTYFGNGMQADWGAHHFDITQWGLGMDGKCPRFVHVVESENPRDKNERAAIYYEYDNGTRVYYGSSKVAQKAGCPADAAGGVTFVGTKGIAAANRGGFFWASSPELMRVKAPLGAHRLEDSINHMSNFAEAIRTGRETICPVDVGISSSNMCLIGNIAHKLGRSLEWDWKRERFANDVSANRLLARENRGEWAKM